MMEKLITLLTNKVEDIRIEATWCVPLSLFGAPFHFIAKPRCLTNIATGSYEQTARVLEAMPYLIQILASDVEHSTIKEQVILAHCTHVTATYEQ
jgi:hypothetical protein